MGLSKWDKFAVFRLNNKTRLNNSNNDADE